MPDGLAVVPLASEEDGVGAGGGAEGELVEGEALAAGGDDALTGRGGEFEGGDRELGDGRETLVVEDGTDGDDRLGAVGVGVAGLLDEARDGERRAVDLVRAWASARVIQEQSRIVWTNLAHEETPEDDTVELGVGPASEEAVKL